MNIVRKRLLVWVPLALLALCAVLLGRTLLVAPPPAGSARRCI